MTKTELFKRYCLFAAALFFIGLGISMTKHAGLGTSTVSSVTNVFSLRFPALTFGTWTIIFNLLFLVGQLLVLRRKFPPVQFLQLPLTFLFGYFTDIGLWIASSLPNGTLVAKLILIVVGNFILAFGIAMTVTANVLLNAPEGFVNALAITFRKSFATTKILFDICWVCFAVILSMLFFHKPLTGAGVGTIISALLVGPFVKLLSRPLRYFCRRVLRFSQL